MARPKTGIWWRRCGPTGSLTTSTRSPLRPEVGAYLNNKLAASTLLFHTLRDREGERTAAGTGDANRAGRHAWLRTVGATASRDSALGLTGSDNRYLVHGGSDAPLDRWTRAASMWG